MPDFMPVVKEPTRDRLQQGGFFMSEIYSPDDPEGVRIMAVKDNAKKSRRGEHLKKHQFKPGNKLGGRPLGARNKLGEAFLEALHEDFQEHGEQAIKTVRTEKPDAYLKVIASILPKEFKVEVNPLEEMTDEQLAALAVQLSTAIGLDVSSAGTPGTRQTKTLQ